MTSRVRSRNNTPVLVKKAMLLLLAAALFAVVVPFFPASVASAAPITADGLLSKMDKTDRVTLTTADGAQKEISVAEMQKLAEMQHAQQQQMQREKQDVHEGEGSEPQWLTDSVDAIQTKDPSFAVNIALSKRSFQEIQRHGYARGYKLTGFSEKENAAPREGEKNAKNAPKKKKQGGGKREEYTVTLVLRAKRSASDKSASTGTRAQKRGEEPIRVSYEVDLLLDAKEQFSVVAAWELDAAEERATRLSIQPSDALLAKQREAKAQNAKPFYQRSDLSTWLLAFGVALIGVGLVVVYTSQRPGPVVRKPRANSADNWELATSKKNM